jgi:hypothetical protein
VSHHTTPRFWECYNSLPEAVRALADKNYELLKTDPDHPSLHYKKVGKYRSVRVGISHRALGVETEDGVLWFWIGTHAEYDKLVGGG